MHSCDDILWEYRPRRFFKCKPFCKWKKKEGYQLFLKGMPRSWMIIYRMKDQNKKEICCHDRSEATLLQKTIFFQRYTWSAQTLINLFLGPGAPGAVLCSVEIPCDRTPPNWFGISKCHFTGGIQIVWGWFM